MNLQVIPWTWRNGSVHLEMRLASFFHGTGPDSELVTHLDDDGQRFVTACGVPWWGIGSSSGIGHTERVTCPECRTLLASLTFNVEVRDPEIKAHPQMDDVVES